LLLIGAGSANAALISGAEGVVRDTANDFEWAAAGSPDKLQWADAKAYANGL
jgi:hypothetical protein